MLLGRGSGIARIRVVAADLGGAALHARFNQSFTEGALITPGQSAAALIAHLGGDDSGSIVSTSAEIG